MSVVYIISAVLVMVHMHLFFVAALLKKDNGLADIAWGLGFILAVVSAALVSGNVTTRALLVTSLTVIWGVRLAVHIAVRNADKEEDWRYNKWRREWGAWWIVRSYLQVFLLQGVLLLVIASSALVTVVQSRSGLGVLDFLGFAVWLVGFVFEAVGDFQLFVFKQKAENRGRIMTTGLWKYTRHPNYFGEATMWWGVFIIALAVPGGWLTIVSPLVLSFLLLKVSGIPMLEKKHEGKKDFEEYKRRTSAFFPLPPKQL